MGLFGAALLRSQSFVDIQYAMNPTRNANIKASKSARAVHFRVRFSFIGLTRLARSIVERSRLSRGAIASVIFPRGRRARGCTDTDSVRAAATEGSGNPSRQGPPARQ